MEDLLAKEASQSKRVFSLSNLLLLFSTLFVLSGCATVSEVAVSRDPKELYDKAVTAQLADKYDDAEKYFRALMEDHPLSPYSLEAQLMLGDVYYAQEKYEEANSYYTNFVALHPSHPRAPYALFQKGMSHFKDVLTVDRDQTSTKKALFAFQDLVSAYPDSPYSPRAGEMIMFLKKRLADREFYIARFYFKNENYKGALSRLRDLLKNFPDAGLTDETLYYIGEAYLKLGEKKLATDAYTTLISNFPESPFVPDAKESLSRVL